MALKQSITFASLPVPEAYIRVGHFVFTSKTKVQAKVTTWASEETANAPRGEEGPRFAQGRPLTSGSFAFEYDLSDGAPSLHAQAYAAAKKLPEYAKAEDC